MSKEKGASVVLAKLKSDRLWALVAFLALLFVNASYDLGLSEKEITNAMWATIAFVLGKTFRSTTGGTLFGALVEAFAGKGLAQIDAIVPDVEATAKPVMKAVPSLIPGIRPRTEDDSSGE
jgi:hypothetical protein